MPANCQDCEKEPAQKTYWGCDGSENPTYICPLDGDTFYACPVRFISDAVIQFIDELRYYEDFPGASAKPFEQQTQAFIDGARIYKRQLALFRKLARGESIDG